MFRKFKLPALALGTALAIMGSGVALAEDHDRDDRDHERREWREHERHERYEHEWREHSPRFNYGPSYGYDPYNYGYYTSPNYGYYSSPSYAGGYYDQWGRWHSYAHGYYDRWGR